MASLRPGLARRLPGILMAGRLIYIMGSSGAGKDTVMRGVIQRLGRQALIAHRVVTRAAHSEDTATILVDRAEFARLARPLPA